MTAKRYLVTGAAGFIGSHLVEQLLERGAAVVGMDNFSTGRRENIAPFLGRMEFVEGDIRDPNLCRRVCRGVNFVLHEAALGSVPRSVAEPLATHDNNVNGTLNMLVAARNAGAERFVFAGSSSAYGDSEVLPKVETMPSRPLSPYAVSKLAGENYCTVFHLVYGLRTVSLRYFNVFGPRQDPNGPYAAVIPRFVAAIRRGQRPRVFGDGGQTRDFTYVRNVTEANLLACVAPAGADGEVFNIGTGGRLTLNALTSQLLRMLGSSLEPEYLAARVGDVRDSEADVGKARKQLGYEPTVSVIEGLRLFVEWDAAHKGHSQ
jgi:nucleoside-diphosphate-sugar epimerase